MITHTQGYPTALLPWDRDDAVELYFVNRVKEATFIKVSLHYNCLLMLSLCAHCVHYHSTAG